MTDSSVILEKQTIYDPDVDQSIVYSSDENEDEYPDQDDCPEQDDESDVDSRHQDSKKELIQRWIDREQEAYSAEKLAQANEEKMKRIKYVEDIRHEHAMELDRFRHSESEKRMHVLGSSYMGSSFMIMAGLIFSAIFLSRRN